jgi:3-deoxy-D-manno-octulosonate 8-phosphate phosphatase (KDO 8-P phosphatase)
MLRAIRIVIFRIQMFAIRRRLRNVKLFVCDVDGVLTSGTLLYAADGLVLKQFSVYDGLGIKQIQKLEINVAILSGGDGSAIEARAKNLGIVHVFTDVVDKRQTLIELQSVTQIAIEDTLFVGDDVNDLAIRDLVSLFIAPANAVKAVRRKADVVLTRTGGNSCIRQLTDEIVKVHR